MDTQLRSHVTVTLQVPVPVHAADGKDAQRSELTMRRPKLRDAKRLAALVGQDLLASLLGETNGDLSVESASKVDGRKLAMNILGKLLDKDALDELTAIVANLCNEDVSVIDHLDLVDLVAVGEAFVGFFPALRGDTPGS